MGSRAGSKLTLGPWSTLRRVERVLDGWRCGGAVSGSVRTRYAPSTAAKPRSRVRQGIDTTNRPGRKIEVYRRSARLFNGSTAGHPAAGITPQGRAGRGGRGHSANPPTTLAARKRAVAKVSVRGAYRCAATPCNGMGARATLRPQRGKKKKKKKLIPPVFSGLPSHPSPAPSSPGQPLCSGVKVP